MKRNFFPKVYESSLGDIYYTVNEMSSLLFNILAKVSTKGEGTKRKVDPNEWFYECFVYENNIWKFHGHHFKKFMVRFQKYQSSCDDRLWNHTPLTLYYFVAELDFWVSMTFETIIINDIRRFFSQKFPVRFSGLCFNNTK